jgi:hypothetical protein
MTIDEAKILLCQMYLPQFDEEEKQALTMAIEALEEIQTYRDAEKQGLLLKLPCKVGSTVYLINSRYTECTQEGQEFDEYSCQGCECLECDSHKEYYIHTNKSVSIEWIVEHLKEIGKTVFLTKEEAEQVLKQMGE